MSKLSNCLYMIELLHARGKMKISELAELLEVKERMVRIYRDDIEMAGIKIDTTKGRDGGYSLSNTSLFPIKNMSQQEMDALTFSIQKLVSKGNDIYSKDAQVALDKLNAVRKVETNKDRHIYFVQRSKPNYEFSNENQKYVQLQEALFTRRKVKIQYEKRFGERSERIIDPYGFVHYNEFFYCLAMCNDKKEKRMFKLSRMKDIRILYDTYKIPDNFDIREEFPKFGLMKEPLEVELLIYPPFAASVPESIWGENQKIEHNNDGSILFRATMSGKESIKKWILGMGAAVEVIKPDSFREDMIKEGRKLLKLYEK
ncbi:transcriptional regulator [Bacillus toyonensis]|uniref:helix-turn-helix transcriptional regulator n=1 Tax=Bacillus toyonensis TaxID=155322 RepID=UPI000BEBC23B|nr:transcriptional regulator [Bacillus toyonensis]MED2710474.1 transcriptional regulator [Bacillus toyonensis]MED2740320.1 transcriptional regulator [Bacillus toyonensis]PDZ27333.1 transcriptional regulator [Bacillus toyonensis]PEJ10578.1 transcriptional regulator [Bacillus toyonensis]PFX58656.1 transcriptional regulator [Bacillus toyonensis]